MNLKKLIALAKKWQEEEKDITACADSNERRGDGNAARQNRAQAFGIRNCTKELTVAIADTLLEDKP